MRSITVEKGSTRFELKLKGIRDDIMRIESTKKTKEMGVPEYLTLCFEGEAIKTYKANGWKVRILK